MEVIASAFAVVSLSVQLLDKIQSVCEFWEKVRGAPKYILDLVQELRLLERVIEEIREKEKQYGADPTLTSILRSALAQVDGLVASMAESQKGLSSRNQVVRTWNGFKVSLKGSQILQFRLLLSETKATLVLARFNLSEKMHYQFHEQTMTALSQGFTNLSLQKKSSGLVSTELAAPAGLHDHAESLRTEMRRVTAGVPQQWIQSGMQVAIDKAVQGMANKIQTEDTYQGNTRPDSQTRGRPSERPGGYGNFKSDLEGAWGFDDESREASRSRRSRRLGVEHFHGSYASISSSIFGTIYLRTNKFYVEDPLLAEDDNAADNIILVETHFAFYPARWLMWWGLRYGFQVLLSRDGASWKNSLQTFQAVPDDSLIFKFCEQGNVMAVNTLLASGQASPWDTNSRGWTPLHVASWHCNTDIIKTLLRAGANREALTFDFPSGNYEQCSPLVTAATITSTISIPPSQRIEALRLLISDLDFTDHESQAWKMILVILERERLSTGLSKTTQVSSWAMTKFLGEMRASHSPQLLAWLVTFSLENLDLLRCVLELDDRAVHASIVEGGHTPLHGKIAENFTDSVVEGVKEMVRRGADPHRVGMTSSAYGGDESERLDTPTSLAMRRSAAFFKWRSILRDLGFAVEDFVREEMERAPLVASGWTVDSLMRLFQSDFVPTEMEPDLCAHCGRVVYHTFDKDEVWWEQFLRRTRNDEKGGDVADLIAVADMQIQRSTGADERKEEQAEDGSYPSSPTSTDSSIDVDLCWKCGVMQDIYGSDYRRGRV